MARFMLGRSRRNISWVVPSHTRPCAGFGLDAGRLSALLRVCGVFQSEIQCPDSPFRGGPFDDTALLDNPGDSLWLLELVRDEKKGFEPGKSIIVDYTTMIDEDLKRIYRGRFHNHTGLQRGADDLGYA